jgi:lipopolysaccharide transport system ATP-binding protein
MLFGRTPSGDTQRQSLVKEFALATEGVPMEKIPPVNRANKVRYGSRGAELIHWAMVDGAGQKVSVVESGSKCRLEMALICHEDIADLAGGFAIKDRRGTVVWGATNVTHQNRTYRAKKGDRLKIEVSCTMWLAAGDYFVTLGVAHGGNGDKIDFVEDGLEFRVVGPGTIFTTSVVNLDSLFSSEALGDLSERGALQTE